MSVTVTTGSKGSCTVKGEGHVGYVAELVLSAAAHHAFYPVTPATAGLAEEARRVLAPDRDTARWSLVGSCPKVTAENVDGVDFAASLAKGRNRERKNSIRAYVGDNARLHVTLAVENNPGSGSFASYLRVTNGPEHQELTVEWDVAAEHYACKNRPFRKVVEAVLALAAEGKKKQDEAKEE